MRNVKKKFRVPCSVFRVACLGQSLVEVMVAVAILALVLTALVLGTTVAMRNANFSKNQAQATKYSQEAMEWLRSQRDQGWDAFSSHIGPFCLNSLTWTGTAGFCSSSNYSLDGMFKRQVVLFNLVDKVQTKVTVSWQGTSGKIHQSKLTSYFTKWQ